MKLNRGISPEDINWSYKPENEFDKVLFIPLGLVVFIILPYFEYLFSYIYYDIAIRQYMKKDVSFIEKILLQLTLILMVGVDQVSAR
jgi:uncharacterized membrane protein YesL